jgi:hypothetical protein
MAKTNIKAALPLPQLRDKDIIRFWSKVDKTHPSGCWLWNGNLHPEGYGLFKCRGRMARAHRIGYFIQTGVNPGRLSVCHNCPAGDNKRCIRADHLWLGTNAENTADAGRKGQMAKGNRNASRLYPERFPRGERCHLSKLTESDVKAIRQMCASGQSGKSIAASYNVNESTIHNIRRRATWKHV